MAALEESLGVTLFERLGKKLALTDTGAGMLEHARSMREAADIIALAATGSSQVAEGIVTISASDGIATHILPEIVRRIRQDEPRLTIEIVASNALSDLRRREGLCRRVVGREGEEIGRGRPVAGGGEHEVVGSRLLEDVAELLVGARRSLVQDRIGLSRSPAANRKTCGLNSRGIPVQAPWRRACAATLRENQSLSPAGKTFVR